MFTALAFASLTSLTIPYIASAQTAIPLQTRAVISYETALSSYTRGDIATALIQGKMAGMGGDAEAQTLVGHILMRGETGLVDKNDAVKWFLKAATSGNTDAMVALGELAIGSHGGLSVADAFKWLRQASDKGRADAMRALADMYFKGKGTAPDPAKGQLWLAKAANNGDTFAERKLGDIYFDTNPKEALLWYEKAAAHGDNDAAYIAAIMYAENFEIRPDATKAAVLLSQAAEAGIAAAQADYGLMVYQGNGAPKSAVKAAQWFKKSAYGGDPEGRFLYAFTLAKGEGTAQNFEEAYYWLLRAQNDSGKTGADEYDQSRAELKTRLENNVGSAILQRARTRAVSDRLKTP